VNTASLNDGSTALQQAAVTPLNNTASVDSLADDDEDNSAAVDDDSNSVKSESASRDSRFETVDSTLPLFTSTSASSSVFNANTERRHVSSSLDDSSENEDVDVDVDSDDNDKSDDDDDEAVQSPVSTRRRFTTCQKPKRVLSSKTKKNSFRKL